MPSRRQVYRGLAALAAAGVAWVLFGEWLVAAVDEIHTVTEIETPVTEVRYEDGNVLLGSRSLAITGYAMPRINAAGSFEAGPESGGPFEFTLRPAPGDRATLRVSRSLFGWPTPLELNVMTGKSPSWKRNRHYVLRWEKPNGSRLEMRWRFQNWFYDDWGGDSYRTGGGTGLVGLVILPARQ